MKSRRMAGSRRGSRITISSVFLVFFTGCSLMQPNSYLDTEMDFGTIKTVAVMPFGNLSGDRSASVRVRDVFVTKLLATYGVYVLPTGEVVDGISRIGVVDSTNPAPEEVVKLAAKIKANAVITGTLREYGEVRSGQTSANVISLSVQLMEAETGKIVWSASATRGGVSILDRLFGGGGGQAMNHITEKAVDDVINQLF